MTIPHTLQLLRFQRSRSPSNRCRAVYRLQETRTHERTSRLKRFATRPRGTVSYNLVVLECSVENQLFHRLPRCRIVQTRTRWTRSSTLFSGNRGGNASRRWIMAGEKVQDERHCELCSRQASDESLGQEFTSSRTYQTHFVQCLWTLFVHVRSVFCCFSVDTGRCYPLVKSL